MSHPLNFKQHIKDCAAIEHELRSRLTDDDIQNLRDDFHSMSKKDWYEWLYKYGGVIAAFLAEPPAVRRVQHTSRSEPVRLRLLLAAIQRVRRARSLLLHVDRHCLFPWAGGSSRDFAVRAAQALDDVEQYSDEGLWPFDGDDPFDETSAAPL